jgi:hypothetical protein
VPVTGGIAAAFATLDVFVVLFRTTLTQTIRYIRFAVFGLHAAMRGADLSTAFFALKRTVCALENLPDGLNFLLPDDGVLFFP